MVGRLCIRRKLKEMQIQIMGTSLFTDGFNLQERQYVTMEDFLNNGYILALLMFMVSMVQNSLLQTHYHLVIREGIRLRAALQVTISGFCFLCVFKKFNATDKASPQDSKLIKADSVFCQIVCLRLHFIADFSVVVWQFFEVNFEFWSFRYFKEKKSKIEI